MTIPFEKASEMATLIRQQTDLLKAYSANRNRLKDDLLLVSGALARGEYQKASGLLDAIIGNMA